MKYLLTVLICCLTINLASAQEVYNSSGKPGNRKHKEEAKVKGFDPSKLVFGGGINLALGTITNVGISPTVGYHFTKKFVAGVGIGYSYLEIKDYYDLYTSSTGDQYFPLKSSVIYPNVWATYNLNNNPYNTFFVQGQFEYDIMQATQYNYDATYTTIQSSNFNVNVPCLLLGVGVRKPLSERVSVTFSIVYDVLQQEYSPYKSDNVFTGLIPRFSILAGF